MKYEATDNRASRRRTLSIAIAITLVVIATGFVRQTAAQQLSPRNKLGRFVPQGSNDAANVLLRGGRDLISDEKWSMAEDMFKKYVSSYPTDKNIDAALYWMAYSQFKMSKFDQCKETVTRLLKSYQDTSWKTDAKTLLAQIPDNYGQNQKDKDKSNKDKSDKDKSDKDKSDKSDLMDMEDLADLAESLSERITREVEVEVANPLIRIAPRVRANGAMPDDDPCEFKIVVLQALFQSDVQRGIAAATDWLKPGVDSDCAVQRSGPDSAGPKRRQVSHSDNSGSCAERIRFEASHQSNLSSRVNQRRQCDRSVARFCVECAATRGIRSGAFTL